MIEHTHATLTAIPELGLKSPAFCNVGGEHRPRPLRLVWHHLLPQAAGGKTEVDNLVGLCDNCHYAVHELLWRMANSKLLPKRPNVNQYCIAQVGYQRAKDAGTLALIPNEGGNSDA